MTEREILQDTVCPTRARLELIRREAVEESKSEIAKMLHEARHLPKDGLRVQEVQVDEVEVQVKESVAQVFEVVEDTENGVEVVAEHQNRGLADMDAASRTVEFGIPFRVRRKRRSA
jgi:hypothetical protein